MVLLSAMDQAVTVGGVLTFFGILVGGAIVIGILLVILSIYANGFKH